MTERRLRKPTDGELAILRVLWRRGQATVRDVAEELNRQQPTGYTTVLKLMQIMTGKGLVRREAVGRAHVYRPTLTEEQTQQQLVRHLLDRAFDGSASKLVLRALTAAPAAPRELAQVRQLIREMERRAK
jgi:predicted transcriptional regulator